MLCLSFKTHLYLSFPESRYDTLLRQAESWWEAVILYGMDGPQFLVCSTLFLASNYGDGGSPSSKDLELCV